MKNSTKIIFCILTVLILVIIQSNNFNYNLKIISLLTRNFNSKINIVDFSENLCSKEIYDSIPCRKSALIYVTTTLCVHDLSKDEVVSASIWANGVWEYHVLKPFLDFINSNSDALVLDVGAQVGEFTLFAAKMGKNVVAVEPFYDNILRIQKAIRQEGLEKRVTLIKNALSNKRGDIKRLKPVSNNIGGQSLIQFRNISYTIDDLAKDKYLVETILFNDLLQVIPKRENGKEYKKAILKIDIEGFEPFAFQFAEKIFDRFNIPMILMEWSYFSSQADMDDDTINMIKFLTDRKYVAYENNKKLDMSNWKSWPIDMYWLKK